MGEIEAFDVVSTWVVDREHVNMHLKGISLSPF